MLLVSVLLQQQIETKSDTITNLKGLAAGYQCDSMTIEADGLQRGEENHRKCRKRWRVIFLDIFDALNEWQEQWIDAVF